jgi:hypothetical protein
LADVISICRELPTRSGFIDNLLLTPAGGIVIVETKLWRNPQARREVVGQILDYAKDVGSWSYDDLERAIRIARGDSATRLIDLMKRPDYEPDEVRFVDAITRNLKLGRFLCIVAGDGIREGVEQLTDFLQQHVGLHFTLGLVELSLWRHPMHDEILIQPRIIVRTVQIERAVIRLDSGIMQPSAIDITQGLASSRVSRSTTITEQQFYERLGSIDPILPELIKAFIADLGSIGIYAQTMANINLKWKDESDKEMNLGAITEEGLYDTTYVNYPAFKLGRLDIAHDFLRSLAALVVGGEVKKTKDENSWRVIVNGNTPPVKLFLLQTQPWKEAMISYVKSISKFDGN